MKADLVTCLVASRLLDSINQDETVVRLFLIRHYKIQVEREERENPDLYLRSYQFFPLEIITEDVLMTEDKTKKEEGG